LNVHNVSDVRQIEVHTAEPLVPGPSCLEVETAIAKLKKYKSPGSDQFFLIPNIINEFVDRLLLESVLPEFDQYLAIYTFSTFKQQFQLQDDWD
jgi:hypothetical protein